ncbi:hypothetical protein TNCV_607431 [Trichonephila clavipes]|nr:hypothetical protein TNCV_607431 [Trichonephila clavipes]
MVANSTCSTHRKSWLPTWRVIKRVRAIKPKYQRTSSDSSVRNEQIENYKRRGIRGTTYNLVPIETLDPIGLCRETERS